MVKINCNFCGKKLQIDEVKLPMQEVKFACPYCQAILLFNRSLIEEETIPPPLQEILPGGTGTLLSPAEPSPLSVEPPDVISRQPQALMVGTHTPNVEAAVKAIGYSVRHIADPHTAREIFCRDHPPLILLIPRQLTAPPLQEMTPLTSIPTADRREGFFILLANELRTGDGDAAFFYAVNLVLSPRDLGSLKQIYREAYQFHQNLYRNIHTFQRMQAWRPE